MPHFLANVKPNVAVLGDIILRHVRFAIYTDATPHCTVAVHTAELIVHPKQERTSTGHGDLHLCRNIQVRDVITFAVKDAFPGGFLKASAHD
jgi:hypothetical protein